MKSILIIICLSFLAFSCKKYNTEKIDSDILVSATHIDNDVVILGQTSSIYSSSGYKILFNKRKVTTSIVIEFKEIMIAEVGLHSFFPATCGINLGKLKKQTYDITFQLNGQKNTGRLIVGDSSMLVLSSDGNVKPK